MAYLAIARKWRPHRFEDLVGQSHVVQTLKNAIRLNRVSHAYLFSGARGIGKTSVARIFAKALRCPNVKEAVPCNECTECVAISESRSVDVVEIDGASNNGVEAVRGIRDNVAYGAASGTYKIYIIDEVHMLSLSAFNALLKTLEEPPAHVIFMFATTEVQKIPLTVLGRCQRFEFRRLSNNQIVERLKFILATEAISISEEGLRVIASHSDGSLRDALSLLDQVLSYFGSSIENKNFDEKQVVEALGISQTNSVADFWKFIIKKDIKSLLALIEDTYLAGVDLKHFSERCLEELRLLYLVSVSKESRDTLTAESLDVSTTRFSELKSLAETVSLIQVERMSQILSKAISQLGFSSLPRFVIEVAAVRMTKLDALERVEQMSQSRPVEMKNGEIKKVEAVAAPIKITSLPKPALRSAPSAPEFRAAPSSQPPPQYSSQTPPPSMMENPIETGSPEGSWKAFVDFVMKKRPLLGALLTHANFKLDPVEGGKMLTLAFGEGSFYEKQSAETKNAQDILDFLKTFFGKNSNLKFSNAEKNVQKSLESEKQTEIASLTKEAMEHPAVLQAKELLGAELIDVRVELS